MNSPSKTTQQWVKELKWTSNFGVGLGGGITNSYFSVSMGQAEKLGLKQSIRKVLFCSSTLVEACSKELLLAHKA